MPATTPRTPEFYRTAPIHFSATRVVPATPDDVFAVLADTPNWPKWFTSLSSAEWTSEPPYGVGSTRRVKAGPVTIDEEFIVWEPGRAWGFTFRATSVPLVRSGAERVDLVAEGDGTRATYHMFLEPLPFLGPVTKVMRRGVEKGLGDGLRGLELHLAG